jgi:hypothetical protein
MLESATPMKKEMLESTTPMKMKKLVLKMKEQTNQKLRSAEEKRRQLQFQDLSRRCWPKGPQTRWGWRRQDRVSVKQHWDQPPKRLRCKPGKRTRKLLGCS